MAKQIDESGMWYEDGRAQVVRFEEPQGVQKAKRTRKGLKVPAYLVCFSSIHRGFLRTIVAKVLTYGRNGDYAEAKEVRTLAMEEAGELANLGAWVEQGFVTRRLPKKVVG
jgi:hypothetical protein